MAQPERNQLANGAATWAQQRQDMDTICQTIASEETSGTDHSTIDHRAGESGTVGPGAAGHSAARPGAVGHGVAGHTVAARLMRARPADGPGGGGPAPSGRGSLYDGTSTIAGPLQDAAAVRYRQVLSRRQRYALAGFIALNVVTGIGFITWLVLASRMRAGASSAGFAISVILVAVMACLEGIRLVQGVTLGVFAARAKDPVPVRPRGTLRVAILTTIVPGKEPLAMVLKTLRAMKAVSHQGVKDVWLLDEGNDPQIRAACAAVGVRHFSRHGVVSWNQASGPFKARTKHGNHNAWREVHEDHYDVVAQMDPDHVPQPDFLERTLGYFNDPDTGFVVAPQVYGNIGQSWIAHGAAVLAYIFHGIIQRGANGMAAPLLIGTNHLYRVTCFKQVGGYQDSVIEDHLTAMAVYCAVNPVTGNRWSGVYTPDVLAIGEGPTSFTDFFNQQKRWAWGIWQILTGHSARMLPRMRPAQRLSFALLQQFYPSVALSWVLGIALTTAYMISGVSVRLPIGQWALLWTTSITSSMLLFLWLRRFNLAAQERKEWGVTGLALMLMCIPVYVAAAASRLARRRLAYAVTAKGDLASPDNIKTFLPHLVWAAWAAALEAASFARAASAYLGLRIWAAVAVAICVSPIATHYSPRARNAIAGYGSRIRSAIAGYGSRASGPIADLASGS